MFVDHSRQLPSVLHLIRHHPGAEPAAGKVVAVVGMPGIGKSTLLANVAEEARRAMSRLAQFQWREGTHDGAAAVLVEHYVGSSLRSRSRSVMITRLILGLAAGRQLREAVIASGGTGGGERGDRGAAADAGALAMTRLLAELQQLQYPALVGRFHRAVSDTCAAFPKQQVLMVVDGLDELELVRWTEPLSPDAEAGGRCRGPGSEGRARLAA